MVTKQVKARKVVIPKELDEQRRFCRWLDMNNLTYFMIPNSGWRNKDYAEHMQYYGFKKGVPDLFICEPIFVVDGKACKSFKFHPDGTHEIDLKSGIFVEMKRIKKIKSKVSDEQKEWIEKLNKKGYVAKVAYGCDEAIVITKKYLGWS